MPRFSGITTRGRCLLAGGVATAACSVVLDERDLLRIGAFVAVLPLLAAVVAVRARRAVRVARELSPPRLPVGGEVEVTLHVRGAALVGALRLAGHRPRRRGAGRRPAGFTIHRLSGRGGAGLIYPLRPLLRGVHAIGPLTLGATDPLGLAEFERAVIGGRPADRPAEGLCAPGLPPRSAQVKAHPGPRSRTRARAAPTS